MSNLSVLIIGVNGQYIKLDIVQLGTYMCIYMYAVLGSRAVVGPPVSRGYLCLLVTIVVNQI